MFDAGKLRIAANLCREVLNTDGKNLEVLDLFAAILIKAGLNEKAVNVLEQSLLIGGPNSAVLYNYGVALRGAGQLVQASRAFKNAAIADPGRADCWFNLGETYRRLENHPAAINALKKATKLNANNASFIYTLGNAFLSGGFFNKAVEAYQSALALEPGNIEYKNNLGVALRKVGKLSKAVQIFKDILASNTKYAAAHNNLGLTLSELEKTSEAIIAYLSALNIAPDYSDASLNLADLYFEKADFENAVACLNKAIARDNGNTSLLIKLSLVLQKQGRLEEAKSILTDSSVSTNTTTSISTALANILRDIGDFEGSIEILYKLGREDPGYPTKQANLGLVYQHQGELIKAERSFRKALEKNPDDIPLHINLAHTLLSGAKYKEGWKELQWRLGQPKTLQILTDLPGEQWKGSDITGKSILAVCEQGAGDCFQFVRFLPLLIEKAGEVVLSVPPSLRQIFDECSAGWKVVSLEDTQPKTDYHVLLMDIPYMLGITDIPSSVPYLRANGVLIKKWKTQLPVKNLSVGLCWQGNRNYETDYLRSIPFSEFIPLIDSGLADFVSVQKGYDAQQTRKMSGLINLGPELDKNHSFIDTAAVIMSLDLIITSDTAVAHLSGALAKPVWLLLNYAPDWRWQLKREDTPWYPTMRLFRQPAPRDWPSVIAAVQIALKKFKK